MKRNDGFIRMAWRTALNTVAFWFAKRYIRVRVLRFRCVVCAESNPNVMLGYFSGHGWLCGPCSKDRLR